VGAAEQIRRAFFGGGFFTARAFGQETSSGAGFVSVYNKTSGHLFFFRHGCAVKLELDNRLLKSF
jgi:hypothetical protein